MDFDVLILGGTVVDGSGAVQRRQDVGVIGDSIAAVGNLGAASARRVVDASDKVVSPGFIDIHTHSDLTLLSYPDAASRVCQGITTEVVGNCSYSPYPVTSAVKEYMTPCLTQGQCRSDWQWSDLDGFRRRVKDIGVAVNVVPLVGHGSIRIAAMNSENRAPTVDELARMRRLVAETMDQGAFGFSTGLTLAPSSYAQTDELVELSRVVAAKGGFYATHSRLWAGYHFKAVEEAIQVGREAQIPVQISHQTIIDSRFFGQAKTIVRMMEQARSAGIDVLYDVYPYTAGATKCDQLLPDFALSDGPEKLLDRLRNPSERSRIRTAACEGWFNGIPWQWDRIQLTHVRQPTFQKYLGRTISEVAESLQVDPLDCFLDLIESQQNDVSVVMFNRDEADVRFFISHPLSMIGSDGASISPRGQSLQTKPHPRYYGTFPRVLGRYVRESGALSLEAAVQKMTGAPAARLGLKDRGIISRGKKADIVVFDAKKVSDQSTFQDPHQLPTGIEHVFVNGRAVLTPKGITSNRPGAVLSR